MSRRLKNLRRSTGVRNYSSMTSGLGPFSSSYSGQEQNKGRNLFDGNNETGSNNHCLKWNLQSQHILKELGKIYGREEEGPLEEFTDVTLFSSEGDCVQAHKIVLMLCSPFFQKLFLQVSKSQKKERDSAIVVLGNLKTYHLKNLVRFMYTGEVNVASVKELEEFKEVAEQFGIEWLSVPSPSRQQGPTAGGAAVKKSRSEIFSKDEEFVTENENIAASCAHGLESVTYKMEPSDDMEITCGEDGVNIIATGNDDAEFNNELNDDYQQDSEEDIDDEKKDPDVTFGKIKIKTVKTLSKPNEGGRRSGSRKGYLKIDPLSEEELERDWIKCKTDKNPTGTTSFYYCHGSRKCPSQLKIKTLTDGTKLFFHNGNGHANHIRGPNDNLGLGLSKKQKEFVIECVQSGVTQPKDILLKFEMSEMTIPTRNSLYRFLSNARRSKTWAKVFEKMEMPLRRRGRRPSASSSNSAQQSTSQYQSEEPDPLADLGLSSPSTETSGAFQLQPQSNEFIGHFLYE